MRDGDMSLTVLGILAAQAPITALACDAGSHAIAVGTELQDHNASIVLWCVSSLGFKPLVYTIVDMMTRLIWLFRDVRASPSQKRLYTEVHSDDITEVRTRKDSHPSYTGARV